jgi:hypothetical protein
MWLQDYFNVVQFAKGTPNVAVRYLSLMLSGTTQQCINDLADNSIQTWFDMQIGLPTTLRAPTSELTTLETTNGVVREHDESSHWLDMKNSCEGVTDKSAMLVFIDSLEKGQLLCHRLLCEHDEGKLVLNSMIFITSSYAATDDDACTSLQATAIQNQ